MSVLDYISLRDDTIQSGWCNVYPIGPYSSSRRVDYGCIGNRSYVESTSRKPAYRIRVKPYKSWSIRCRLCSIPNEYIYVGPRQIWRELKIHRRRFDTREMALMYLQNHRNMWSGWTRDHAEVFGNPE